MSDASTAGFSRHERWLVGCTRRGCSATFAATALGKPVIRAALIRSLLLGEFSRGLANASFGAAGVRICGARIEVKLDLADCARPGTGLPALALQNCDIPDRIDLSAARLA